MQAYAVCATFILKGTHFFFFQMKDHSILKKEIYNNIFTYIQCYGIIITLCNWLIDLNCFSCEQCGPNCW